MLYLYVMLYLYILISFCYILYLYILYLLTYREYLGDIGVNWMAVYSNILILEYFLNDDKLL